MVDDCVFCTKFGVSPNDKVDWFDQELSTIGDFVVVPGLGAFFDGYVMIVPRFHYSNLSILSDVDTNHFLQAKELTKATISNIFGNVILFEHGGSTSGMGGGCVEHAHLHIMSLGTQNREISLADDVKAAIGLTKTDTPFLDAKSLISRGKPYLILEDIDGLSYVGDASNLPGQFMRRIIAKKIGIPDIWDYSLFPNYDLIRSTINKLTPWPK
jgi:diadenosine tetraphosphate (Ap4A) HIT family hydrolase